VVVVSENACIELLQAFIAFIVTPAYIVVSLSRPFWDHEVTGLGAGSKSREAS
jgi:hypothetical protein